MIAFLKKWWRRHVLDDEPLIMKDFETQTAVTDAMRGMGNQFLQSATEQLAYEAFLNREKGQTRCCPHCGRPY